MAYRAIPFTASFLDENADPISGAAPTVTIRNSSGTAVVTAAAMTERTGEGGSYYTYLYTPVASDTFTGVASTVDADALQSWVLLGSETSVDESGGDFPTPEEIAEANWEYDPRTLTTSNNVYVISPINPINQLITLIAGNSYTSGVDDSPLDFESSDFPVLTGAAITFNARHIAYADDTLTVSGSVIDASTARVELTAAQTGGMLVGLWSYELVAVLSDSTVRTLVSGQIDVKRPIAGGV